MHFRLPSLLFCASLLTVFVWLLAPGFYFPESALALSSKNNPMGGDVFVQIAKTKNPAVVNVSFKSGRRVSNSKKLPDAFQDYLDRFFGGDLPPDIPRGAGSGFIIDAQGHVLTNHHVVDGGEDIRVVALENGAEVEYSAVLVGADAKADLALLKINPQDVSDKKFPYLEFGDSDDLKVGQWVIAIGNPFNLDHTVTVGVVSAKKRTIGSEPYEEFIQTDASINPGNSGGPLLNIKGEVIGINTAIIAGNAGGNVGVGFAIPINLAKKILPDLRQKGKVVRGYLGMMAQDVRPELATSYGLEPGKGVLAGEVVFDGPAHKAGIKRGDVLIDFDGKPVESKEDLSKKIASAPPGSTVPVKIIRDGKNRTLTATLGVLEDKPKEASLPDPSEGWLGLEASEVPKGLADALGLKNGSGAQAVELTPGGPAHQAGLQRGDVIVAFNGRRVASIKEFGARVKSLPPGTLAQMEIIRDKKKSTLSVTVASLGESETDKTLSERAWLGIIYHGVSAKAAENLGMDKGRGVQVVDVIPNSPAHEAGLQIGDVALGFNKRTIENSADFQEEMSRLSPGDAVKLKVLRDGKTLTLEAVLGTLDETLKAFGSGGFGLEIESVSPETAGKRGLKNSGGVLVARVHPGTPGQRAGFRKGDLILEMNKQAVKNPSDFHRQQKASKKGDTVLFLVERKGTTIFLAAKLNKTRQAPARRRGQ